MRSPSWRRRSAVDAGRPIAHSAVTCRAALAPVPTLASTCPVFRVWAALDYGAVPRSVLLAFKDGGRTDAAPVLARRAAGCDRVALCATADACR